MSGSAIQSVIDRLEEMSKKGESYANAEGRHGWRNPIRRDTGPILRREVMARDAHRVLEVGTAHGLSALYLVQGWSRVEGRRLDTIEFDEEVAKASQARFDELDLPVRVHIGEAQEVIAGLPTGNLFDLVFLDAQKSHYGPQWRLLTDRGLVGPGTVLLVDNVIDRRAECANLFEVLDEQGVAYDILPTECGLLKAVVGG